MGNRLEKFTFFLLAMLVLAFLFSCQPGRFALSRDLCSSIYKLSTLRLYMNDLYNALGKYPENVCIAIDGNYFYSIPIKFRNPDSPEITDLVRHNDPGRSNLFIDPLSDGNAFRDFQYISNGEWYIVISRGPDKTFCQKEIQDLANNKSASLGDIRQSLRGIMYDPTNGTFSTDENIRRGEVILLPDALTSVSISRGDIILSSENIEAWDYNRYDVHIKTLIEKPGTYFIDFDGSKLEVTNKGNTTFDYRVCDHAGKLLIQSGERFSKNWALFWEREKNRLWVTSDDSGESVWIADGVDKHIKRKIDDHTPELIKEMPRHIYEKIPESKRTKYDKFRNVSAGNS